MRYLYLILLIVFCQSCKANQQLSVNNNMETNYLECPEDGVCTFEVIKDKSLKLLRDDFGALYQEVVDGDKLVIKFEYKRNDIPNTADSQYIEQIFIELNPNNLELNIESLKGEKLLFARLCYCKGQTGYYKINQGKLRISKIINATYQLNLTFKVDEVPQIITTIDYTFSLK